MSIVPDRAPRSVGEVHGYEEPLRTAGLVYLLDEYYAEQGTALEPYARRKLKFEVESWQSESRSLEVADRDFVSLSDDLDRVSTNEDLAAWFRHHEIGTWYSRATNRCGPKVLRSARR